MASIFKRSSEESKSKPAMSNGMVVSSKAPAIALAKKAALGMSVAPDHSASTNSPSMSPSSPSSPASNGPSSPNVLSSEAFRQRRLKGMQKITQARSPYKTSESLPSSSRTGEQKTPTDDDRSPTTPNKISAQNNGAGSTNGNGNSMAGHSRRSSNTAQPDRRPATTGTTNAANNRFGHATKEDDSNSFAPQPHPIKTNGTSSDKKHNREPSHSFAPMQHPMHSAKETNGSNQNSTANSNGVSHRTSVTATRRDAAQMTAAAAVGASRLPPIATGSPQMSGKDGTRPPALAVEGEDDDHASSGNTYKPKRASGKLVGAVVANSSGSSAMGPSFIRPAMLNITSPSHSFSAAASPVHMALPASAAASVATTASHVSNSSVPSASKLGLRLSFVESPRASVCEEETPVHAGSTLAGVRIVDEDKMVRIRARRGHRYMQSYDVTNNGTLQLHGFEITNLGIMKTPDRQTDSQPEGGSGARSPANESPRGMHDTLAVPLPAAALVQKNSPEAQYAPPPGTGRFRNRATSLGIPIRLEDLVRLGELGRGQNGIVYKAIYLPTLSIVALKTVSLFNQDERRQMLKELKAFNSCSSPYIVNFIGACFSDGKITMVLEYMNRGSLEQVVKRYGALPEPVIRHVTRQVLLGLQSLHGSHQVHRDIKPANLLVNSIGEVKISDFGLMKQLDSTMGLCLPLGHEILTQFGFVNYEQMVALMDKHGSVPVASYDPQHDRLVYEIILKDGIVLRKTNEWIDIYSNRQEQPGGQEENEDEAIGTDVEVDDSSATSHVLRLTPDHLVWVEPATARRSDGGYDFGREVRIAAEKLLLKQIPGSSKEAKAYRFRCAAGFVSDLDWKTNFYDFTSAPVFHALQEVLSSDEESDKKLDGYMEFPPLGKKHRAQRLFFENERKLYDSRLPPTKKQRTQAEVDEAVAQIDKRQIPMIATKEMKMKAFLQLYGFFLGDGTIRRFHHSIPDLVWDQSKPYGIQYIVNRLNILGIEFEVKRKKRLEKKGEKSIEVDEDGFPAHEIVSKNAPLNAFFVDEYQLQEEEEDEWERSGKWLAGWVWALSAIQKRYLIEGLIWADGDMAEWIGQGAVRISTSSKSFRDELVQLLMEAGYSSHYSMYARKESCGGNTGHQIIAKHDRYMVSGSERLRTFVVPMDKPTEYLKRVPSKMKDESCWCVSLPPNSSRRIFVRKQPIEGRTNPPLIVSNCATFVGTRMYLSPERVMGDMFSYPSDIWSVGITLIYCAMGALSLPHEYWALVNFINDQDKFMESMRLPEERFSPEFRSFVESCLQREPADRGTASSLMEHPFITAVDPIPPTLPYTKLEDRLGEDELAVLCDAVIARWYSNISIENPFLSTAGDVVRFKALASQLGCEYEPVRAAFLQRLVKRNSLAPGMADPNDEHVVTMAKDPIFAAGNSTGTMEKPFRPREGSVIAHGATQTAIMAARALARQNGHDSDDEDPKEGRKDGVDSPPQTGLAPGVDWKKKTMRGNSLTEFRKSLTRGLNPEELKEMAAIVSAAASASASASSAAAAAPGSRRQHSRQFSGGSSATLVAAAAIAATASSPSGKSAGNHYSTLNPTAKEPVGRERSSTATAPSGPPTATALFQTRQSSASVSSRPPIGPASASASASVPNSAQSTSAQNGRSFANVPPIATPPQPNRKRLSLRGPLPQSLAMVTEGSDEPMSPPNPLKKK